ncbi:unnamed protein product, partial [Symbiodinium sp. CCMP2456]
MFCELSSATLYMTWPSHGLLASTAASCKVPWRCCKAMAKGLLAASWDAGPTLLEPGDLRFSRFHATSLASLDEARAASEAVAALLPRRRSAQDWLGNHDAGLVPACGSRAVPSRRGDIGTSFLGSAKCRDHRSKTSSRARVRRSRVAINSRAAISKAISSREDIRQTSKDTTRGSPGNQVTRVPRRRVQPGARHLGRRPRLWQVSCPRLASPSSEPA